MDHTVNFVFILEKKELHIVLDVALKKGNSSRVSVGYTLVPQLITLNTVLYAKSFHLTCLWTNMIQNMGKKCYYESWLFGISKESWNRKTN